MTAGVANASPQGLIHPHTQQPLYGFASAEDAVRFNRRWRQMNPEDLRHLYPEMAADMDAMGLVAVHSMVFSIIGRKTGLDGLRDAWDGDLWAVQAVLRSGDLGRQGAAEVNARQLGRVILLDLYVYGTNEQGRPDFDRFIRYRQQEALSKRLQASA